MCQGYQKAGFIGRLGSARLDSNPRSKTGAQLWRQSGFWTIRARICFLDLPDWLRRRLEPGESTPAPPQERHRILSALSATNWNKSKAAERLSWSRMTLYRKLAKYQLDHDV